MKEVVCKAHAMATPNGVHSNFRIVTSYHVFAAGCLCQKPNEVFRSPSDLNKGHQQSLHKTKCIHDYDTI